MAMTKVKNLQLWCKKMADGYRDVEVRDMAASWKSGLVFCAIIHRFRPDLIDYDSLSKENVFDNNQLAFEVAEKQLNIPAFLEAADMVAIRVPDRLSVVTYVSQYYNYFHNKPQLGGPGVNKFDKSSKPKDNVSQQVNKSLTPAKSHVGNTQIKSDRQESIGDKCMICHEKVYLLERHIENSKLYHRSCFRKSEHSPTSKVFKRQPYSPLSEDRNDIHSTKQRKIEKEQAKTEPKDSGMDFWQRRAQQKSNKEDKNKTNVTPASKSEIKFEPKNTEPKLTTDVPIWKRGLEKGHAEPSSGVEKDKPKVKSGLADKFKELDQRNLKNIHGSEIGGTERTKDRGKGVDLTKKTFDKKYDDKPTGVSKLSPVPKPRQNVLNKVEKMETDTNESHEPKPVPRYLKQSEPQAPKAVPRHLDQGSKSPPVTKKSSPVSKRHDFIRPKTPPLKSKSEFTLNLTKNTTKSASAQPDKSPSSPPPLPVSSPPRMQKSHPQTLTPSKQPSPAASPRATNKDIGGYTKDKNARHNLPPAKPPRSIISDVQTEGSSSAQKDLTSKGKTGHRVSSPMDTSEVHVAPKAAIKGPQTEHTATLVVPNRPQDEKKSREVFGGLLKSLADVRQKHDTDIDDNAKLNGAISDKENKNKLKINGAMNNEGHGLSPRPDKLKEPSKTDLSKKNQVPQRPKSSFISQNSSLFDSEAKKEPTGKVNVTTKKTTTTTVVTTTKTDKTKDEPNKTVSTVTKVEDDVPEWKRQLEQRKKDQARPKSADILSEKSDRGNVPMWQIEAEKRKEARKGGYVDPEKVKIGQNRNNAALDLTRPLSPEGRKTVDVSDKFVPPSTEEKIELPQRHKIEYRGDHVNENKKPVEGAKKKITVDHRFNFEDVELKPVPKKPVRPATQPTSPKSPTSPKPGPARPPPPKAGGTKPGKHHISAYQIQKQLQLIDTKLTHLELKGRTLEDSIRNAEDEDEDDLMIAWFQLVNEKNDLVRKECDFIYISREQELELEQQQIDQKLRELVDKPHKTEGDRKEEEYLMEKLVDVVYQRNQIVDSIDEDRLRYLEEDSMIEAMLQKKGFLKDSKDGAIKKDKNTRR